MEARCDEAWRFREGHFTNFPLLTGRIEWRRPLGPDGRAAIEDLLPRTELSLELRRGDEVLRARPNALVLEPGETRELAWSLAGARLSGRVLRADRSPVAGAVVWLLPRKEQWDRDLRLLGGSDAHGASEARTDAQGSFHFEDVAPGRYWVGPAPRDAAGEGDPPLPLSVAVHVESGVPPPEVEVVLPETFLIRGRVLQPDGQPAADLLVYAHSAHEWIDVSSQSDDAGRFVLGPVPEGEYLVGCAVFERYVEPEPVPASPGSGEVLIQLAEGVMLSGRIVDEATGEPVMTGFLLSCDERGFLGWSFQGGTLEARVRPGTYAVAASAEGGLAGVLHPLVVGAGGLEDVVLRLAPGARVRVRHRDATEWGGFTIRWQGHVVAQDGLPPGTESTQTVVPGELEVELRAGDALETRRITVAAGEEVVVVFGDEASPTPSDGEPR